ncbi:hypothetical protein F3N42_01650 [Marinihelvus fidelis]|uniref:Uncharacterized protein n=1 Tax=Marinihelvus fidelis TaxID=2613842 RepID=A0A5N0TDJ1_9GAMM|nr:hypothetical protein [Marinihelvus fidelis]KAA9133092.1 hypothetical protein F3N42_01650 [Marinihelvus fidelis]
MRILILLTTFLFTGLASAETLVLRFAKFDHRSDLAALSQEMMANEISDSDAMLRISIAYRFETITDAEAACKLVWGPTVNALASGTALSGSCTVSLTGVPTPHSLYTLLKAASPVAKLSEKQAPSWSVSREATAKETGDAKTGIRLHEI